MQWLENLTRLGIQSLRNWPLRPKLGLLMGVLTAPMLALLVTVWVSDQQQLDFTRRELGGLALVHQVMETARQAELLRGAKLQVAYGGQTPQQLAERQSQAQALKQAIALLDGLAIAHGTGGIQQGWTKAKPMLDRLVLEQAATDRVLLEGSHTRALLGLREFSLELAEHTGLLFEPEDRAYFLMDLTVERLLPMVEDIGQARALAMGLLARGDAGHSERSRVILLSQRMKERSILVLGRMDALRRSGGVVPDHWSDTRRQVDEAAKTWIGAFEAEALVIEPQEVADAGARSLKSVSLLHGELLQALRLQLELRERELIRHQWLMTATVALALAIALGIAWLFYRSFMGSVRALLRSLSESADSDFSRTVDIAGRDELAEMGRYVERSALKTSHLVAEMRTSATRLGEAGRTVADEGMALAARTDLQASSLRQSVEVMEHLVGQVATTADGLSQIGSLTEDLRAESEEGTTAMAAAMGSMSTLQDSARRVAEINGVIDDIAFQTNLVALNASVEAAKAGESGRGFAVVAAEIRELARRCVDAASEVRDLIEATNSQVELTSSQIASVNQSLGRLQSGVNMVSTNLQTVANASAEQSAGLEEVSAEILALQGITKEGVDAVSRFEGAARSLLEQAASLGESVREVKLRQGSADEAQRLVREARDFVTTAGWEHAAAEFNDPLGRWCDRGMYIFAWDENLTCLAYGVKPEWVGRPIHEFPNGTADTVNDFITKALQVVASPGRSGWIDYRQLDAQTMIPVCKSAYIVALEAGGFMGCSVVRSDFMGAPEIPKCQTLPSAVTAAEGESSCAGCPGMRGCAERTPPAKEVEIQWLEHEA